jgi:glutamate racemase
VLALLSNSDFHILYLGVIVMEPNTRPVGVFDSGVGGISVLSELVKLMPYENFIYFGDSANAPYGTKPLDKVAELTIHTADMLIAKGCKCLVIACNTATVAAVSRIRNMYPAIPVIGIEPALKPAALDNPGKRILVLATHITLNQSKFLNLMTRYKDLADIFTLEAPGIVEAVEKGLTDSQEFMDYLKNLLHEYIDNPVDAVVLGCTHYPFVKKQILEALQYTPAVYDGGNGTARETLHQLTMHSIVSHSVSKGTIEFLNSDVGEIELSRQLFAAISKGKN